MENGNHRDGRGIFYGVIGVATLVVAIIGATFAYFTASQNSNNGDITGNAASVSFGLRVEREETTDRSNGGLIPMSNSMVEAAVNVGGVPSSAGSGSTTKVACVDDVGNSVCQIYKVTITNTSAAALFLDGYITLTGGLATATASADVENNPTVMRWAQVFKDSGTPAAGHLVYSTGTEDFTELGSDSTLAVSGITTGEPNGNGLNKANICNGTVTGYKDCTGVVDADGAEFNSTDMPAIVENYIRISSRGQVTGNTAHSYNRSELEDALVFDLFVPVNGSKVLYFVVWLHENGANQTPANAEAATNFFGGTVTFMSGQGGEVSATFSGVAKVSSQSGT